MENFIEIPDTQGSYLINRSGEIFSLKTNRILKANSSSNSGYSQVVLRVNGKSETHMVHRLVAKAYLPNPNGLRVVNHLDGSKLNNNVENLEWCTHSDNSRHALENGLSVAPPKWTGKFGAEHNRSVPIYAYDNDGNFLAEYEGINDAARKLGVLASTIGHAIKDGAFSRLAQCFFFYEKKNKKQVREARQILQKKLDSRGQNNKRLVYAYNESGQKVAEYLGAEAAAKAHGLTSYNVVDSIRFARLNKKAGIRFSKEPPE
jgi:hypothetical protein